MAHQCHPTTIIVRCYQFHNGQALDRHARPLKNHHAGIVLTAGCMDDHSSDGVDYSEWRHQSDQRLVISIGDYPPALLARQQAIVTIGTTVVRRGRIVTPHHQSH